MSIDEFETWSQVYQAQPFDDLHRYHRPAALVASSLGGGSTESKLDYLCPVRIMGKIDEFSDADLTSMQTMGITRVGA